MIKSVAFQRLRTASLVVCAAVAAMFAAPTPANAAILNFYGELAGFKENPPNGSPGTGSVVVAIDDATHMMTVSASFSDLIGATTAAHIHCCVAPPANISVATQTPSFIGFPLGVTSGTFNNTYDMTLASSYRAGFITDNGGTPATAFAALLLGMRQGNSYFNIHTDIFPSGEIRGFLATPVPAALPLFATGLGLMALLGWRRKQKAALAAA